MTSGHDKEYTPLDEGFGSENDTESNDPDVADMLIAEHQSTTESENSLIEALEADSLTYSEDDEPISLIDDNLQSLEALSEEFSSQPHDQVLDANTFDQDALETDNNVYSSTEPVPQDSLDQSSLDEPSLSSSNSQEELEVEEHPSHSSSSEITQEELEVEVEEKPKTKTNLKMYAVIGLILIIAFCGGGLFLYSTLSSMVNTKPPMAKPSTIVSRESAKSVSNLNDETIATKEEQTTPTSNVSDELLFNAIEGVKSTAINLADQDPQIRSYIEGLQVKIHSLNKQVKEERSGKEALAEEADKHRNSVDDLSAQLVTKSNDIDTLTGDLNQLKQSSKQKIDDLNQANTKLTAQVDRKTEENEKLGKTNQQLRAELSSNSLRYTQVIEGLSNDVQQLSALVQAQQNKSEKPKKQAPLAELRWIAMDYSLNAAVFDVFRNGVKDSKPLTLSKGETLRGRGVVSNVDDYGCITFETGKTYEPLNGKCR